LSVIRRNNAVRPPLRVALAGLCDRGLRFRDILAVRLLSYEEIEVEDKTLTIQLRPLATSVPLTLTKRQQGVEMGWTVLSLPS
jgi:hypothetical protein